MKTAVSSIERDDEHDIRTAARHAARRDGLSLVDWLDRVMTKSADALGLGLSELGPNERIEAVRQRLGWGDAASVPRAPLVAVDPPAMARAPRMERSPMPIESWADTPAAPIVDERHTVQRAEIESKLNALFAALERPARRPDHAAAMETDAEADVPAARASTLLGETAISPAARNLEQAIAEIADRQAYLDSRLAAEPAPLPRHVPSRRFGSPRDAAEDLRRHFGSTATPERAPPSEPVAVAAPEPVAAVSPEADALAVDVAMPAELASPAAPEAVAADAAVSEAELAAPAVSEPARREPVLAEPVATVFTDLQGDVTRLAKRLEAGPLPPVAAPAGPARETTFADIRALLDEMRPDASIDTLGRHVEALSARLDKVIDRPTSTDAIARLSQRIEEVHAELTATLTAEKPAPAVDMAAIERMVHEVVGRAAASDKTMPLLQGLDQAMQGLADKLDHLQSSQADAGALADLQAQVTTLASRIDRSDDGLSAIVAMERSLGDLVTQIGDVRDVATEAAREAAHDVVREARLDAYAATPPDPMVDQVARDLADFRQTREEADKRLHTILAALNTSLERVVERLGTLEDEAAHGHVASVAVAPAVAPVAAFETAAFETAAPAAPQQPATPAISALSADWQPEAIDLDMPLEPGKGRHRAVVETSEVAAAGAPDPTSFIAAARRAAQSAALEQTMRTEPGARRAPAKPAPLAGLKPEGGKSRRPLLLALAGLVLLLGAAQVVRLSLNTGAPVEAPAVEAAAPATTAAPEAKVADAAPAAVAAPASADAKPADVAPAAAAPVAAAVPAKPEVAAKPNLPTLAMGPAAAVAAAKVSENAARVSAAGGIGAGLRELAQNGHADAQFEMGQRLAEGRGVPRDLATAASWFEKSARQGLAPAAYRLGSLYEKGLGVTRDAAQAISWYQKAADAGNVRAMHNLAVLLAEGAGGKPDYTAAGSWFTRAAESGVRDSQFNLGILYARGLGVEQSLAQSYRWFALAATKGDADAAKKRDEVAQRLDPAALTEAKKAVDMFRPAQPVSAANEVPPPAGGWDAVVPTAAQAPAASAKTPGV